MAWATSFSREMDNSNRLVTSHQVIDQAAVADRTENKMVSRLIANSLQRFKMSRVSECVQIDDTALLFLYQEANISYCR